MNRTTMALAAFLFVCAPSARASAPVSIETNWNEKTVAIATTGVTSLTFDVGGFGASGGAVLYRAATFNGVDGTTYGAATVVTSTWTNVTAFDYTIFALGSTATLKIAQLIKMPAPLGTSNPSSYTSPRPLDNSFSVPLISTSAAITIPVGVQHTHVFRAKVTNPVFILTNLSAAATYFLTVNYGVPNIQ